MRKVKSHVVFLAVCSAILALPVSSWAFVISGWHCNIDLYGFQVDESSYYETVHKGATTPSVATIHPYELLNQVIADNCDSSTQEVVDCTRSWTSSESLSHSCSGSMTAEIGAELGVDAVAKLSLAQSVTLTNGWQKTDSWTHMETQGVHPTVAAHSAKVIKTYGKWKSGTFTKSGYREGFFKFRTYAWGAYDLDGYVCCDNTTSTASGSAKYQETYFDTDDMSCNAE